MHARLDQHQDLEALEKTRWGSPVLLGVLEESVNDRGQLVAALAQDPLEFFLEP
jgi:hypothetical protein